MLPRAVARSAQIARAVALARSAARPRAPRAAAASTVWSRGMASDDKSASSRFSRPQNPVPEKKSTTNPPSAQTPPPPPPPPSPSPSSSSAKATADSTGAEPRKDAEKATPSGEEVPSAQQQQQPDLSKLPDLTQGIPSTLEYETTGATDRAALAALEEGDAAASGSGGRGKGELPASAYISSSERRRQRLANYMFSIIGLSIVGGAVYLGRNWDEDDAKRHPDVPNGWGLGLWWNRMSARLGETMSYYQEPAFEKLLPDPDPSFERPYTLVLSLEDLLVHSEWSREHGWRLAKRPGMDYFIRYLSHHQV
ncbi:hypothetical protein VTK73DRAFT_3465 [Phialemonium thermophilum]|uniref:FCP1 homology domain-containing protein n=1 Tax=Phialemonium thermophilum TaxID=223376 RepID=A0ABR3VIU0_9PEZI